MSARKTALERLEDLATEKLGRGACISLDRAPGGPHIVNVWRADGTSVVAYAGITKTEAIKLTIRDLKGREVQS